jgi:hypothetical protein
MKKAILSTVALLALVASNTASWADGPGFAGNTIHSVTPGFGTLWFSMGADHTFTRSDGVSGTWDFDGSTLCYHAEGQDDLCGLFDGSKNAGDSWSEVAWDGNGDGNLSISAGLTSQ